MICLCCFVLVILCLVEAKETAFLPNCFDWTDTSCWSNAVPQDNDVVYLSSCPSSPIVLSSVLSLNFLQIGNDNCGFDLSFAPGSTLTVFQFSFFGGTVSGSGFITLQGPATFVSDIAKELHVSVLVLDSLLVDTTSPILFQGSGSITSSGIISFISDTVLQYSPDHDHQDQSQPYFNNQGTIHISVPNELRIDIPLRNSDVININSGIFQFTNPDELWGNFFVHSKLLITTDTDFRRGVLLEGNGEIEIGEGIGVTFDGYFLLQGNVILRSGATLDFLSYSNTRFFFSNHTECNSKVTWNAGSRLTLRELGITSDCGHFTIKSDAQWEPHSSFSSLFTLFGSSIFEVSAGSEEVLFDTLLLDEQAQLLVDRFVTISHFTFAGGKLAGTGSVVSPFFLNFTSGTYKELHIQIVNTGQIYFDSYTDADDIPVGFEGGASILNAGTISVKSGARLFYSDNHDFDDRRQPSFSTKPILSLTLMMVFLGLISLFLIMKMFSYILVFFI
ncbi:hypothetical protein GEMRC1_010787 [Eukaryota sp. GEM-RC1]